MADPGSHNKTHVGNLQVKSPTKRKSCTHFLCKPFLILCILIVIPLFPSKAPEFINQPILIKFWEPFYLSFVGIVVCYGIFSRRNVEMEPQNLHSNVDTQDMYLGHLFECDDKKEFQSRDSKNLRADPNSGIENMRLGSGFRNPISSVSDSLGTPPESINDSVPISGLDDSGNGKFVGELGFLNVGQKYIESNVSPLPVHWNMRPENERVEMGEEVGVFVGPKKELQSWDSKYFRTDPDSGRSGFRNPISSVLYSLGSPPESVNGTTSGLDGSGNGNFDGELDFLNVGQKYMESNVLPLPVHWNLRSEKERVEIGEVGVFVNPHSEFMPLPLEEFKSDVPKSRAVGFISSSSSRINPRQEVCNVPPSDPMFSQEGTHLEGLEESNSFYLENSPNYTANSANEYEFESLESLSIRSKSSSFRTGLVSSPNKIEESERCQNFPSSSVPLESENLKVENLDEKKSTQSSSTTLELSIPTTKEPRRKKSSKSRKTKLVSKSYQDSYVSSSEMNVLSSFKDGSATSDGLSTTRKEDLLGNEEQEAPAFVKSDIKSEAPVKASLRGRSVRTIGSRKEIEVGLLGKVEREMGGGSRKQNVDNPVVDAVKAEGKFRDQRENMIQERDAKIEEGLEQKVGKKSVEAENLSVDNYEQNVEDQVVEAKQPKEVGKDRKEDMVRKRENKAEVRRAGRRSRGLVHPSSVGAKKENSDDAMAKPKSEATDPICPNGSKQGFLGSNEGSNSKDGSIREISNVQEDDVEVDKNDEIDKKAGEFIAKFKEQMRFEKVAPPNEVDKKAGEFIAKFKEQIRLEKISKRPR